MMPNSVWRSISSTQIWHRFTPRRMMWTLWPGSTYRSGRVIETPLTSPSKNRSYCRPREILKEFDHRSDFRGSCCPGDGQQSGQFVVPDTGNSWCQTRVRLGPDRSQTRVRLESDSDLVPSQDSDKRIDDDRVELRWTAPQQLADRVG